MDTQPEKKKRGRPKNPINYKKSVKNARISANLVPNKDKNVLVDLAVRSLMSDNRALTDKEIKTKLVALNICPSEEAARKALERRPECQAFIRESRASLRNIMENEIVPLALEIHKEALSSSELDLGSKYPYVKLAEDKYFGEHHHITADIPLAQVQILIQQAFDSNVTLPKIEKV